ncbi:MAG TPA: SHOCT domain-containing protein [Mycobacteriales bacterium]|jgi:putative membrane protein|nr:SHOCT domain-containing protein [Mycobacteriales bacterium]
MSFATALTYAHPYYEHDHGWWWIGYVVRPLVFALVVFLIVRFVIWRRRTVCGGSPWHGGADVANPTRILAERYAKGEIDATEYRERLAVLGDKPPKASN